jgi:multidrug efflux pump subunit AcrA (membrane-fusion protein)
MKNLFFALLCFIFQVDYLFSQIAAGLYKIEVYVTSQEGAVANALVALQHDQMVLNASNTNSKGECIFMLDTTKHDYNNVWLKVQKEGYLPYFKQVNIIRQDKIKVKLDIDKKSEIYQQQQKLQEQQRAEEKAEKEAEKQKEEAEKAKKEAERQQEKLEKEQKQS